MEQSGKPMSAEDLAKFRAQQEGKMIFVGRDNTGTYQPQPTKDQVKAAEEVVENKIEIQLGRSETVTAGFNYYNGRSRGGDKKNKKGHSIYGDFRSAWMEATSNTSSPEKKAESKKASEDRLNDLFGGLYIVKWTDGGLAVYDPKAYNEEDDPDPISVVGKMRDLSRFMYGGSDAAGIETAYKEYDEDKKQWSSNKGNKPKAY